MTGGRDREIYKSNDTKKAQVHLSILNHQLPTFINSLQSVKVLLDYAASALKNNDINNALVFYRSDLLM